LIIYLIRPSAGSADVCLYEFTNVPVAEELEKLSKRDVLVRVVIDEKSYYRWLVIYGLAGSSVPVRMDTQ
ncbi:hypothetical protein SB757_29515, partial [Pseudomonas sp. SIMBA_065]